MISKRHCAIITRDGKVFLRDFDSTNGCTVNEEKVEGEVELKNGHRIKVGPLEFEVKLEKEPAARPTPVPPTRDEGVKTENGKVVSTVAATRDKKPEAKKPEEKKPEEKKPQEKKPEKPAAKAPVQPREEPSAEDDVAAMLLSLQDDSSSSAGDVPIPEGTTVMDLKVPDKLLDDTKEEKPGTGNKDDKKDPKKEMGNTINAAKSILEKMMRRPR
jgi:predicted component of type VI protein secretion system